MGVGTTSLGADHVLRHVPTNCCRSHSITYPYGGGCDLEVMQPAQGALPVGEVGRSQLVEGLQCDCPRTVRVPVAAATPLGPRVGRRLLAELSLVHEYGQGLLPW